MARAAELRVRSAGKIAAGTGTAPGFSAAVSLAALFDAFTLVFVKFEFLSVGAVVAAAPVGASGTNDTVTMFPTVSML